MGSIAAVLFQQSIAAVAADAQRRDPDLLPEEVSFLFGEEPKNASRPDSSHARWPPGPERILEGLEGQPGPWEISGRICRDSSSH